VTVPHLKKQIRKSQRAKAALVEANLRLVVTTARQAVKKSPSGDLSFHDACQDGIIGLTRAAEKFDPDRDFRFSTYSLWWIKGEITKSINHQSSQIRLPRSARKKINDIRINERLLMAEKGRKPTDAEVAAKCDLSVKELAFYRRSAREVVSIDQSLTAQNVKGSAASGDAAKGRSTQIGDLVRDAGPTPDELASKQMFKDDVRKLVTKSLTPREQVVIRLRFGLDDGEPQTLKAISKKFGVDPKKIKQLEERALSKLRETAAGSSFDM
jgi:RNA polymerase primary sigma factor